MRLASLRFFIDERYIPLLSKEYPHCPASRPKAKKELRQFYAYRK
jgi:hypothetical protein